MVLIAAKRAKLRAERALKAGDTTVRPRGTTNKKAFEELKEQMRTYDLERKAELARQTQDLKDHISNECKSLAALIGPQTVTPPSQQESDSSLENGAGVETRASLACAVRPSRKLARRASPPEGAHSCKTEAPSAELPIEDEALKRLRHHEKYESRKYSELLVRRVAKGETAILRAQVLEKYMAGPRDAWVSDHISSHGQNKLWEIVEELLPTMRQGGHKDTIEAGLTVVNNRLRERMSPYSARLNDNMDCEIWKAEHELDPWVVVPNASSLAQMVELREAAKNEKEKMATEHRVKMEEKRKRKEEESERRKRVAEERDRKEKEDKRGVWLTDPRDGMWKRASDVPELFLAY